MHSSRRSHQSMLRDPIEAYRCRPRKPVPTIIQHVQNIPRFLPLTPCHAMLVPCPFPPLPDTGAISTSGAYRYRCRGDRTTYVHIANGDTTHFCDFEPRAGIEGVLKRGRGERMGRCRRWRVGRSDQTSKFRTDNHAVSRCGFVGD